MNFHLPKWITVENYNKVLLATVQLAFTGIAVYVAYQVLIVQQQAAERNTKSIEDLKELTARLDEQNTELKKHQKQLQDQQGKLEDTRKAADAIEEAGRKTASNLYLAAALQYRITMDQYRITLDHLKATEATFFTKEAVGNVYLIRANESIKFLAMFQGSYFPPGSDESELFRTVVGIADVHNETLDYTFKWHTKYRDASKILSQEYTEAIKTAPERREELVKEWSAKLKKAENREQFDKDFGAFKDRFDVLSKTQNEIRARLDKAIKERQKK